MNRRMDRTRLNIGTYYLREYARTEQHVRDLRDCGIDFVFSMDSADRATLDLFEKYGVGCVVNDVLPGWWGGNGEQSGTLHKVHPMEQYKAGAAAFRDHPAIWGVDIGDEPSALDFPYYGRVFSKVNASFPNQFVYLNLYPNYASVAMNTASQTTCQLGTATYQEHIDKYLPKKEKRYYTIKQVCELMGIKRSTYFTRAQNGDFIIVKDGRTTKIDADDLDAKLESKTVCKHVRTRHKG